MDLTLDEEEYEMDALELRILRFASMCRLSDMIGIGMVII